MANERAYGPDRTTTQNNSALRSAVDGRRWGEMLAMLNAAQQSDWKTMLGFGLGRLLRNYYQRGYDKRERLKGRGAVGESGQDSSLGRMASELDDYKNSDYMNDVMDYVTGKSETAPSMQDYYSQTQAWNKLPDGTEEYIMGESTVNPYANNQLMGQNDNSALSRYLRKTVRGQ